MVYRSDNRTPDQMRPVNIVPTYISTAEGSCLIELGNTRVICTATIEDTVPQFLRNSGKGWVTAEYGMLPRSTLTRSPREVTKGRPSGRTHEIQRLIGRSLRAVTDMTKLGERTTLHRLRRDSGRWRHAYGLGYRRIRRHGTGHDCNGRDRRTRPRRRSATTWPQPVSASSMASPCLTFATKKTLVPTWT